MKTSRKFSKAQKTFLLGNVLAGVSIPLGKIVIQNMPLMFFLFPRYVLPGIVLMIMALALGRWQKLSRKQIIKISLLSFVNVFLSSITFYWALSKIPVSYSMLVPLLMPMAVYVFAVVILKEKLQKTALVGGLVSVFGVIVLFVGHTGASGGMTIGLGEILLLVSLILSALSVVYSKDIMRDVPTLQFVSLQYLIGSLPLAMLFVLNLKSTPLSVISTSTLALLVMVCLIVAPLGYLAFYAPMRDLNLEENSNQIYVQTIVGVLLGVILLNESLSPSYALGMAIICVGMVLGRQDYTHVWAYLMQPKRKLNILEIIKAGISKFMIKNKPEEEA